MSISLIWYDVHCYSEVEPIKWESAIEGRSKEGSICGIPN